MMTHEDLKALVSHQARDEGLWFHAQTASEAYLQQELRRLHGMCEAVIKGQANESEKCSGHFRVDKQ